VGTVKDQAANLYEAQSYSETFQVKKSKIFSHTFVSSIIQLIYSFHHPQKKDVCGYMKRF
jgi:hypothetical protein